MPVPEVTTLQVRKGTRERLKTFGSKGESYDGILLRLMEIADERAFFVRQAHILRKSTFRPLDEL